MLQPKKVKFRKWHKAKTQGQARRRATVNFGKFGLKAKEGKWISARQLEAARKVITKYTRKGGKMWIRIFPDRSVTAKGGEIGMGKGKGAVDRYVAPVQSGTIIFEIDGIDENTAREAFRLASYKLPLKTEFVIKK
jgi:large subunit ribosomal protein L16